MNRLDSSLGRLQNLYPKLIDLSLGRLERLLAAMGHPHLALPPVIHVAGTNGKGSVCAFIRAMAEAAGYAVHVYTSPHLVRYNERIRLAGRLVSDEAFAAALDEVAARNAGGEITVFEALTAAAFWLFARVPADLCVVEVGLGGRFDATNVIGAPRVAALTSVSMDHQEFLGEVLAGIAAEKAGIIKPGCVAVTGRQAAEVLGVFDATARAAGVPLLARGRDWDVTVAAGGVLYDGMRLPMPGLAGAHQVDNAGIALVALRHSGLEVKLEALAAGLAAVEWPGRLQRLGGALAGMLPAGSELWLDGAHNPGGGAALAVQLDEWVGPTILVVGMKQSKDVREFLAPLVGRAARIFAVAEPGQHLALPVAEVIAASGGVAEAGPDVAGALRRVVAPARVLICGSLYLAGEVLRMDAGA